MKSLFVKFLAINSQSTFIPQTEILAANLNDRSGHLVEIDLNFLPKVHRWATADPEAKGKDARTSLERQRVAR